MNHKSSSSLPANMISIAEAQSIKSGQASKNRKTKKIIIYPSSTNGIGINQLTNITNSNIYKNTSLSTIELDNNKLNGNVNVNGENQTIKTILKRKLLHVSSELGSKARRVIMESKRNESLRSESDEDEISAMTGGCGICGTQNFENHIEGTELNPNVMILCDTCNRAFHIGCLNDHHYKKKYLAELPSDDWFCSHACSKINKVLNAAAKVTREKTKTNKNFYIIRGCKMKDDLTLTRLSLVEKILSEAFEAIVDEATNEDLLHRMVKGTETEPASCSSLLLNVSGNDVAAAIFKCHDGIMEVPLVATDAKYRRKGHCTEIIQALDVIGQKANLNKLVIPSTHTTVDFWREKLKFSPCPPMVTTKYRLMLWPGTTWMERIIVSKHQHTRSNSSSCDS